MNISTDDPKLTAYALGELSEGERREIERELARSPELRAAVEEIRAAAAALQKEFAAEEKVISRVDAVGILARAEAADKVVPFPRRAVAFTAAITALAACVAAVLAWQFWFSIPRSTASRKTRSLITISTPHGPGAEKFEVNNADFREFEVALNRHGSLGLTPPMETLRLAYDVPLLVQRDTDGREIFNVSVSYNGNF